MKRPDGEHPDLVSSGHEHAELLQEGIGKLRLPGLHVPENLGSQMEELAALVSHWTRRIDLTSYSKVEQVAQHLILDSVALSQVLPPWEYLTDIGSGAGFPGVPLACLYPKRQVALVESRLKRHHFHREIRRRLNLTNLSLFHGRAEALLPSQADLVLGRAVGPMQQTIELLAPWACQSGWLGITVSSKVRTGELIIGEHTGAVRPYWVHGLAYPRHIWLARSSAHFRE